MDRDSLHRLGRLGKPWGHQGDLCVHLETVEPEEIQHAGSLFVDIEGQLVPFFFTKLRDKGRELLIKFDEIEDPQAASVLVGRDIYAPPGHLADGSDESWDPEEFIGCIVMDDEHGELGEVTGLEGTDENPVLVVLHGEKEVLIPVTDDIIIGLDPEQNIIQVRTPAGLGGFLSGAEVAPHCIRSTA
ncbi:MAG: 16S rRNA processing protein RimM [Flavobacteriales bacterium]|nr:16S rRNA processing protein RimM [Flavobacteriales bacterium]